MVFCHTTTNIYSTRYSTHIGDIGHHILRVVNEKDRRISSPQYYSIEVGGGRCERGYVTPTGNHRLQSQDLIDTQARKLYVSCVGGGGGGGGRIRMMRENDPDERC